MAIQYQEITNMVVEKCIFIPKYILYPLNILSSLSS